MKIHLSGEQNQTFADAAQALTPASTKRQVVLFVLEASSQALRKSLNRSPRLTTEGIEKLFSAKR